MGGKSNGKPIRGKKLRQTRRSYSDELKAEAVQMYLDGHSAQLLRAELWSHFWPNYDCRGLMRFGGVLAELL
jgi:hypothetical protein